MHRLRATSAGLMAAVVLGACTAGPAATPAPEASPAPVPPSGGRPSASAAPSGGPARQAPAAPTPAAATPASTSSAAPRAAPRPDPLSLQALIAKRYDGHGLRLGREGGSTSAYRQYAVTYEGGGLTISGRIAVPRGRGPFPAVVLAHGYVDPAAYVGGQTMLRERDHLARAGYVALHIDYRNHAESDDDPANDAHLRLGYTEDAINAGLALQQYPLVDRGRIGIVGRSMGGGVVLSALVVRPGLFKAAVAYSPVSSNTIDNFNRWVRPDPSRSGVARQVIARLGTPEAAPARWAATSPRTFFARVSDPLMIHHGTLDEDCPIQWTRDTVAALRAAGKPVESHVYEGERHTFTAQWPLSIRRTTDFLDRYLRR
ncbi:MAG TPA: prolyl oligopeptidase family serine peptidase [Intrasporangium sp.]|uniref:alpha/beta hydrolase family protein n=1 Tax=Intrasporangium sp. TaxID=1925024 RepID=UPI002D7755EE|nr:prolyl oligopeptidase family serine peptidase [Intrasporangium sp.]HET7398194.1 prolyl oligopeptidase family serine peptidase [Intrasporangium sp.]